MLSVVAILTVLAPVVAWLYVGRHRRARARRRSGLRPKAVVITGASSGLGFALAYRLASQNDHVVAVDNDENGLRRLARLLPEHSLTTVACDVTDPKSVRRAAQATVEAVGSIDAILNFAGVIKGGPLVEMDDADLALVMSVNVVGTCLINKHFFPLIKPGPAAKIVNVASEVSKARISTAFNAPYTMSKLAVEAYSDSLRQELSLLRNPIAVTVVQAGAFKTPLTEFKTPLNFGSFGKGRWAAALRKAGAVSELYIRRHSREPALLADAVAHLVHSTQPPRHLVVNMSLTMRAASLSPQPVLDFFVRRQFGEAGG